MAGAGSAVVRFARGEAGRGKPPMVPSPIEAPADAALPAHSFQTPVGNSNKCSLWKGGQSSYGALKCEEPPGAHTRGGQGRERFMCGGGRGEARTLVLRHAGRATLGSCEAVLDPTAELSNTKKFPARTGSRASGTELRGYSARRSGVEGKGARVAQRILYPPVDPTE
jgi:hypothetical protein